MEEINTDRGRATKIIDINTMAAAQPTSATAPRSRRVASRINKPEINRTLRVSLNSRISSTSTSRILASMMPAIVTVNRPDSCAKKLDPAKAPKIIVSTAVLRR